MAVTVQINCWKCKKLVLVENKQVAPHYDGDVLCSVSGEKYVPQRCSPRASEDPRDVQEFMSRMPPLPDGAHVVGAHVVKCEEHNQVLGGIAIVQVPKGAPSPEEFFRTQGIESAVETVGSSSPSFEDIPVVTSKYGAN